MKFRFSHISATLTTAAIIVALALPGCGNPPNQTTSNMRTTVSRTDSVAARPAQDSTPPLSLTLPVLDALFYEEGFENELKSQIGLSDGEIQKLKSISRASVEELTEEGSGDYTGSARAAAAKYEEEIRNNLGEDKAAKLGQLVRQRLASGEVEGMLPAMPNAVPTDTRLVVNIPAYRLDVFQEGRLMKSYRIGIGYPEFPLPTGMRRAETIIFNPSWTPPDEPWVKGKFQAGRKVEAGSKDNPLGYIKIPIGLPSLIHGGKAVARLGTFASHGCVGLTNDQVQDLTVLLGQLSGTPLTLEEIAAHRKEKGKTSTTKLAKPVPVELRYETIVAEAGGLHIFRDVYERGTNTLESARRILELNGVGYDSLSGQEKQSIIQALDSMNRDPKGKPIVASGENGAGGLTAAADSGRVNGVAASKVAGARKGKVTSNIVGRKDILIPIASLTGKGYPAPADLHTGTTGKPAASSPKK